jgi:selenide,water dikinase
MAGLAQPASAAVLVGTETSDDAGVYQLNDREAIVTTADFITPLCDDPFLFGQVAAANALSDVYAMGGRPLAALALCVFPKALTPELARAVLAGGQAKVNEAGAYIIGGHTVRGDEMMYGLSVTGVVAPDRVLRNVGARPGDALVLTKPLGSGLIINGMRKGAIDEAEARPTLERLAQLNRVASEIAQSLGSDVHAMTDVTGFGLVGHALEMAGQGGIGLSIDLDRLKLYPRVRDMVAAGVTTGSTKPNRQSCASRLRATLDHFWDELVHDPQTSGGLIIAVDNQRALELVSRLLDAGVTDASCIGEVRASPEPYLELVRTARSGARAGEQ